MHRLSALLLVAAGLSISAVGCAQCDTCDDFPAPCTGPNCAGGYSMPSGPVGPVTYSGPMQTGQPAELLPAPSSPGGATVPPAPSSPGGATVPPAPPVGPSSEPKSAAPAVPKA
jgi:hypothetical protein